MVITYARKVDDIYISCIIPSGRPHENNGIKRSPMIASAHVYSHARGCTRTDSMSKRYK